jgi:arylsulfatase A-like enzyme
LAGSAPTAGRVAVLAAALALLAGGYLLSRRFGEPPRPDIVLVVWDTTRADRLSAYGHGTDTTPWLRGFARDAVLYRRAYSPSPWTPPAHASLFTGLLPRRHGLLHGKGDRVGRNAPLLAQTLRNAGYETVGFTANVYISAATGLSDGFDSMTPLLDREEEPEDRLQEVREWLAARARREEEAKGGARRPLFLFFNFMDAHLPRIPRAEDLVAVTGKAEPPEEVRRALEVDQKRAMRHLLGVERIDDATLAGMATVYDAAVRRLDARTAALEGMLRDAGLLEGAFVAVVSDHGEHLGEHGKLNHQFSVHDELLRIPMVVRWPGRLQGGRTVEEQVRLQDLHPTILEAARVPAPPGTGLDAFPLTEVPLRARALVAEFHRPLPYLRDVRDSHPDLPARFFSPFFVTLLAHQDPVGRPGARKLVVHERRSPEGEIAVEREELFDLAADPGETRNLLADPSPADAAAARRLAEGLR